VRFFFLPAEIAAQLCHRQGFVWMDSSLPTPGAISVLTADPVEVLQGHIDHDWEKVRAALRTPRAAAGGLYGWVGYDGHFTFGIYPHGLVYDHDTSRWYQFGNFTFQFSISHLSPVVRPPSPLPAPSQPRRVHPHGAAWRRTTSPPETSTR
jgi:para-aminobenzoate synthetase component 1